MGGYDIRFRSVTCFMGFVLAVVLMVGLPLGARAFAVENPLVAATPDSLGVQGSLSAQASTVPMLRLYNPYSGEHFYTANVKERDHLKSLGWRDEGVGWNAPASSSTPVHRLYNAYGGEHHYTMSAAERDGLVSAGWRYEGVGWYSADQSGTRVALYRQYNPNAYSCNHNFTVNPDEHCHLTGIGWRPEGAAWYAVASTSGFTGWIQVNGAWRYYSGGAPQRGWLVTGRPPAFAAIGSGLQRYWLTSDYSLAINRVVNPSNAADKGAGYQAFATSGGYVSRNAYLELSGSWYHTNDDGLLSVDSVTNGLVMRANSYSSPSQYLIMVDIDNPRTVVFEGSQGRWRVKFVWDCCTGSPSTPTVTGVYHVGIKGYSFGEGHGYSCYYYTQFWGDYLFHTRKYYAWTHNLMDGRIGVRCSEGCVRLYDDCAQWIYYNVPSGTTVVTTT